MEPRRYSYRVLPREIDSSKRATVMTIGDYILHTAGEDADRYGFGVDKLQESNMTWVLSRIAIEMSRYPAQNESYTIDTWVEDVSRVTTTRNFTIRDGGDKLIGCASTYWAVIDFTTRNILDLRGKFDYSDRITPKACPIEKPAKIAAVDGALEKRHTVAYTDVDFNRHANSMKYVEWMINTLPLQKLTDKTLNRFDINFIHETMYGEEVGIYAENSENADRFELRLPDGTAVCRAQLIWDREPAFEGLPEYKNEKS